mgnify:CR=1 FL=1
MPAAYSLLSFVAPQCGRKESSRLPVIIGGGDLINALGSQPEREAENYVTMPSAERADEPDVTAARQPAARTIKSSLFGGYVLHNQGPLCAIPMADTRIVDCRQWQRPVSRS